MLNFKSFEKIAEDEKTVTMRHEKGHEMRIILKSLRPIEREQIKRLKMAEGGEALKPLEIEPISENDATPSAQAHSTSAGSSVAPPAPPVETLPTDSPTGQSLQSVEPAALNIPHVPASPPVVSSEGTLNPGGAAQTAQTAIDFQSKIDSEAAKSKAKYDQQYLEERQRIANQDAQNYQEMKAHTDEFANFAKSNPINPGLYGQSQTDSQRVSTGVGLFLGGLGGQGHSNLALDFLNKNIDRSIQAQRENVNNQKTVWGAYRDLYGDANIATNLAKVSANDLLVHQVDRTAAQLGTAQAAQRAMQLKAQKAIENSKLLQDSAVDLKSLPGSQGTTLGSAAQPMGGATASNAPASDQGDRILNQHAQQKYDELKYNHTKTPQQISAIQDQYQAAVQADKSIDQIKALWPELRAKATWSGYISNKLDPHTGAAIAGALSGGATAATGAGLPLAGGAAALGAGLGEAGTHIAKGALNGISGQQGTQYNTAVDSLVTQIGNALGTGITPTEKAEIARDFVPTKWDDEETASNKLEKLIKKIKSVTKTSALSDAKMTND